MATNAVTAEAIREIERLTKAAATVAVVAPGLEDSDRYLLVGPGGEREWIVPEPGPLDVKLATPAEVYRWAIEHPPEGAEGFKAPRRELYLSAGGLSLVLDADGDRRGLVSCSFAKTEQFAALAAAPAMDQLTFVRWLRRTMHGCLPADLLAMARSLRWQKTETATGSYDQNRADHSLGKSVELAAAGGGAIAVPEIVAATVPVLDVLADDPANHATIQCVVEVLHERKMFCVSPLPGELDRAMADALASIADARPKACPPLYLGSA